VPGIVQSKLIIGEVNDPLEHEADRIADQVMRMADSEPSTRAVLPRQTGCNRATCEAQMTTLGSNPVGLDNTGAGEALLGSVHDALRMPGHPLDFIDACLLRAAFWV
jgi:hypothetical protein